MIKFACSCQTVLEVSNDFAGSSLQCPKCKRLVDVPTLSDLQAMTEDGTFKLDELKLHDDSHRLEELKRAFAPGRVDELGNEIDLRQNYAGDDENVPVMQEEDVLEVINEERIPRKYDPVTGELIRELGLQTEEAKFDPSTIPMAKAVLNYASGVAKNEFSGWGIIPQLGTYSNIFVMGIILFVHFFLQFMMVPMAMGMLMILPGFIILFCLVLSHYANVVEDIGVERNDELPRPLRNVNLYEDMWKPFLNMTTALLVCYGPIMFAHRFPGTASLAYIGTILVLGTIAFPAVLLTTTTSGTILNLAPGKLLRVISAMGVRYLFAVGLWVVTAGVYFVGIMGTMLALAALFTALSGTFWGLGVPVVIAYALLFIGVVLMHAFCWYLGLQYRRHNEDFDWYLQRHRRKIEMIKSPTGIMVPAPNKPIAPLKPPVKGPPETAAYSTTKQTHARASAASQPVSSEPRMKVALAQINPTVGDLAGNLRKHIDFIDRAKAGGATLVVFPEMSLIGYPAKDLLLKAQFIDDNLRALQLIASRVSGIDAIVGYAERNTQPVGRPLHNAVALVRDGTIVSKHFKTLLPTYDVFDESRYFEPGPIDLRNQIVTIGDTPAGLSICEDLWNDEKFVTRRLYHQNPIADLHTAGARVMINASASPFVEGKPEFRLKLFGSQAKQFGRPLIVVNQVGGNDELVFDGNSVAFDSSGNVIAQAKAFAEDLVVCDLRTMGCQPVQKAHGPAAHDTVGQIYQALLLGLRDYVRKCGFKTVVLGLSGGIDSALTATLAVHALGADKVVGVAMPSRFSSDHSVADARALAKNLGIAFHIVPIKDVHDAYEQTLSPTFRQDTRSADSPLGDDLTEQNIQARVRGALLMAFSNRYNHLLLTTGNKSEIAVGYCTLYGDMCGGLAVISDVPKTTVWQMSRWINQQAGRELIPVSSIEKVPSAELRPNQTDQDSLPPYDVLDAILERYVEDEKSAGEIIAEGFDADTVARIIKLTDRSEYKRRQAAPGLKVTSRAFGFGRRMPIAQKYEPLAPKHGEPSPGENEPIPSDPPPQHQNVNQRGQAAGERQQ